MGIDPLTHKPITTTVTDQSEARDENDSAETTSSTESKDELTENTSAVAVVLPTLDDLIDNVSFCTDEVPMIEPHEIVVSSENNETTTYSSSFSSSSSSSASNSPLFFEEFDQFITDLEFPEYFGGISDVRSYGDVELVEDSLDFHGWDLLDQEIFSYGLL